MPQFLEKILKKEYGANSSIPYKIMNAKGLMSGPNSTPKGDALQAKHERDAKKKSNGDGVAHWSGR